MHNGARLTGTAGLRGFQGASLEPAEFREQVKRAFNVFLTKHELGAVVKDLDRDGDGVVDGAEFLRYVVGVCYSLDALRVFAQS